MKTTLKVLSIAALVGAASTGCDEHPDTPALGSVQLTETAPTIQQGFTTVDGWNVKYTQFLAHFTAVNIAGSDQVLTASAAATVFDLAAPDQELVSSTNRVARAWEDVNLQIGPATAESTVSGNVSAPDLQNLIDNGYSIFVQATMTRGAETKTLKAGYRVDTKYEACTSTVNGVPQPGLVVPKDGLDSAVIGFAGDVLFFDNLVIRGHAVRGNPIAAADSNKDGVIDNAELGLVQLDQAFRDTTPGLYEQAPGVTNLDGFIGEQARSILVTFRDASGSCTETPVTTTP